MTKYTAILLIFFVGCAHSQHKHPHDHGISQVRGHLKTIAKRNKQLSSYMRGIEYQIAENRALKFRIEDAEKKLEAVEETVKKRLEAGEIKQAKAEKVLSDTRKVLSDTRRDQGAISARCFASELNITEMAKQIADQAKQIAKIEEKIKPVPAIKRVIDIKPKDPDPVIPPGAKSIFPEKKQE